MNTLTIPPHKKNKQQYVSQADTNTSNTNQSEKNKKTDGFFMEIFKFAVLALVIVLPFRLYIAQPFIVSGSSMVPTFHTGEYIIVDQATYHIEEPKRGDVVVFRFPGDPSKFFIKRIIGLPGEIVQLANGETTIIDQKTNKEIKLDEKYLVTDKTDDHLSINLSSNEYFVMGDNRSASSDSRMWGPVPRKNIIGRALIRLLPINKFSLFPGAYIFSTSTTENITINN